MTPQQFHEEVVPRLVSAWDRHCFCSAPGFQKLVSFNFHDYKLGPVALADAEIVINEIIRERFWGANEPRIEQDDLRQTLTCPQCNATCDYRWNEYNIHMSQSSIVFQNEQRARQCMYLVGFYGFRQKDFRQIHDFQRTSSIEDFIAQFIVP